jgi:6-pyruvoyl-tetrahydropterin synthase
VTADGGALRGVDEGVARRLKALACTAPLHDLDGRKSRLDWLDATRYQMAEIGLQAIDQVTLAMDFDHGADQAQVVRRLRPFVAAQVPDAPAGEHEHVAQWVIENLINVGSLDRGFRVDYGTVTAEGHYVRRRFDFKLLVEVAGPDGEVYLRASDEAINVLVGALDTDVESAQVAAEVKLENLISRGRLGDARLAAEQARYRTVQYAEALRQKLDATRRDVRSVDWLTAVPALLDEALTHIESRYRAETAILANIADARDEATEPGRRRQAAELVDVVSDCIQRHTQLQTRLQEAGATFRAEQDRQQFSGRPRRAAIDVFGQLLRPCLALNIAAATGPAAAFFSAGAGVRVPSVPSLTGLVETLLTPPVERDPLGQPMVEPDLEPVATERFDERVWEQVNAVLDGDRGARRLSALLAQARDVDPELPALVVLRVLHGVGSAIGTARNQGDPTVLLALDDGTVLRDPDFGGSDLLVATAGVFADAAP